MDLNIGVAPYGAYKSLKNGNDGDGWDGSVQFFDKKGIGSCAFTEHNRKLAHSGVELIKELVTYAMHCLKMQKYSKDNYSHPPL